MGEEKEKEAMKAEFKRVAEALNGAILPLMEGEGELKHLKPETVLALLIHLKATERFFYTVLTTQGMDKEAVDKLLNFTQESSDKDMLKAFEKHKEIINNAIKEEREKNKIHNGVGQ